ncbi:CatB-related O-acetyltransferase [Pseudaminobacter sp. 19-2017]|uniref:CatB-related O-acetyltransferase n=1 Tax=Pseudaminobacter soli (ex Zhang et al. 2022) TaxID=2831468 RepID=A0A942I8C8_9HYPH|nr:CatB-related O-acetyltransferase [Pseudaminobacter soli]MBS3648081.1 CatB-related O-acetyltransferase [Pseudaminobacter soli]
MKEEVVAALGRHRVTFMGPPSDTRFGFSFKKDPIALEPFIQFRGGAFDVWKIGAFTYLGCRQTVFRHVDSIGRFCSIAPNVTVGAAEHATGMLGTHSMFNGQWDKQWPELFSEFGLTPDQIAVGRQAANAQIAARAGRVKIGNDVWIGDGAYISRGVSIGDGAVIAARSVVTRDVPPYGIVGGVPARVIRYRFDEEIIGRLLAARWWEYGPAILRGVDWSSPHKCIDVIEQRVSEGFPRYTPKRIVVKPDDSIELR